MILIYITHHGWRCYNTGFLDFFHTLFAQFLYNLVLRYCNVYTV